MTKKLLQKKFILELKEEDSTPEMEDDAQTTHSADMVLDEEEEDEEEDILLQTSSSSPNSSSTSSSRLIHSGSHPIHSTASQAQQQSQLHDNKDFLLFRKMTAEAAAAVAAAATSAAAPPVVPLPLRGASTTTSDFLLPSAFKFHPRFSDEHWKAALSSLYNSSSASVSSPYYFPSPFLVGKLSPLLAPSFPRMESSGLSAFSSPFQPPLRSFPQPELRGGPPLWSFDPRPPSPPEAKRPDPRMSSLDPHKLFAAASSGPPHEPPRASSPPAMKRYKRERLVLPASCTLSKDQIIHMPIDQFNDYLARSNFSEEELSRLKDARRKGKNRVAARRSRDHRLQEVRCLKTRQERVKKDKVMVFKDYETSIEDCKLWERIHELFSYNVSRFVEGQGFKGGIAAMETSSDRRPGPSTSIVTSTRAFNPPPLVLNSC